MYNYATVDGVFTATGAPTYAYAAKTAANDESSAAYRYETKINAYIKEATDKIMAVKIDNTKYGKLTTWNGTTVWSEAKIGYSYDKAVKYIDAIVTKYVGTAGVAVVIDGTTYDAADSLIFKEYKQTIKNNWNGWGSLEKAN
jgi:hypothetical protein